jgi:hypothetical protein
MAVVPRVGDPDKVTSVRRVRMKTPFALPADPIEAAQVVAKFWQAVDLRDPAMRWIVGGHAVTDHAASTSQMGRFETGAMTEEPNLTTLAGLSGR